MASSFSSLLAEDDNGRLVSSGDGFLREVTATAATAAAADEAASVSRGDSFGEIWGEVFTARRLAQ